MLQIAAHERVRRARRAVRDLSSGCAPTLPAEHAVGRVIARPFTGVRQATFSGPTAPRLRAGAAARSYLQELQEDGIPVHTVGKVGQLFAASASTSSTPGATNAIALARTT